MKATELIDHLKASIGDFGDIDVYIETGVRGRKTAAQKIEDVLFQKSHRLILTSKEALEAKPYMEVVQ